MVRFQSPQFDHYTCAATSNPATGSSAQCTCSVQLSLSWLSCVQCNVNTADRAALDKALARVLSGPLRQASRLATLHINMQARLCSIARQCNLRACDHTRAARHSHIFRRGLLQHSQYKALPGNAVPAVKPDRCCAAEHTSRSPALQLGGTHARGRGPWAFAALAQMTQLEVTCQRLANPVRVAHNDPLV